MISPVFVNAETAAERMQVSVATFRAWVQDGTVPPPLRKGQIVRWHWPSVEAALIGLAETMQGAFNDPQDPALAAVEKFKAKAGSHAKSRTHSHS